MPQLLRSLLMISCAWKLSVKAFSSSTIEPIVESSQVKGRAVVGRRVRDLVCAHGADNLRLLERPAPVPVDEAEGLAGRVEELLGEFAVGRGRGPRPPLLLGLELLDALREAPVDGLLPARETTSDERHETRRRTPRDAPLVGVDLSTLIRVQDLQGLLQPRRVEQKLQVLLAARLEELDDFLRTARSVTRSFGCSFVCVCVRSCYCSPIPHHHTPNTRKQQFRGVLAS